MHTKVLLLSTLCSLIACHGRATAPPTTQSPPRRGGDVPYREPAPVAAGARAGELACSFHWRKNVASSFDPRDEATARLRKPGDARELVLGDARIHLALGDSPEGGGRLLVAVDLGDLKIDDEYDFGASMLPAALPGGGFGFTGLHYLSHPSSGAELQYSCGTGAQDGPRSPAPATVQCELVYEALEGTNEFLQFDTRDAHDMQGTGASAALGDFTVGAGYRPGNDYESGDISVDAGMRGGGGVHVLYQLPGQALPRNVFAGRGGFTGRTTIRRQGGAAKLSYGCQIAKP